MRKRVAFYALLAVAMLTVGLAPARAQFVLPNLLPGAAHNAPAAAAPRSEMPMAPGEIPDVEVSNEKPDDDVLNKYYDRCMNTIYTDLSTSTREEFCACSAAQMKDTMTPGEMTTMTGGVDADKNGSKNTGGSAVDMRKLAVNVVAPCFAPVAQELEYNNCERQTRYVHFYKTRGAFDNSCRCVAGRAGDYVQNYGRDLMAYTLAMNPRLADDPAKALREAPEYREEVAKAQNPCMINNVYK